MKGAWGVGAFGSGCSGEFSFRVRGRLEGYSLVRT